MKLSIFRIQRGFWLFALALIQASTTPASAQFSGVSYHHRSDGNDQVILFIHGFTSDQYGAWTNRRSGAYWPDIVANDPSLVDFDVATVDYVSTYRDGPTIDDIVDEIEADILRNLDDDQEIVVISHSLGGILIREVALNNPKIASRIKGIVTLGTPMGGSKLADYAAALRLRWLGLNSPILAKLQSDGNNRYLDDLASRWMNSTTTNKLKLSCAAEGLDTQLSIDGVRDGRWYRVVSIRSAYRSCDFSSTKLLQDEDHETISKPYDGGSEIHDWVRQEINGF